MGWDGYPQKTSHKTTSRKILASLYHAISISPTMADPDVSFTQAAFIGILPLVWKTSET